MSLLDDLRAEEVKLAQGRGCKVCKGIATMEDAEVRSALTEAAAGKLPIRALMRVSKANGLNWGYDSIKRHRLEGHTP